MNLKKIKQVAKCCITEKPLSTSKVIHWVQLPFKATWPFPIWGNIITGEKHLACALVHDDAVDKLGRITEDIKFAVQIKGEEIIYHAVSSLQPADKVAVRTCRQCGCSQEDACHHPEHGNCWWVEDDLCSHCQRWPGEATRYSKLPPLSVDTNGQLQ